MVVNSHKVISSNKLLKNYKGTCSSMVINRKKKICNP